MRILVGLWLVVFVSVARADELADRTKAVDAMLAAQTKALIARDNTALEATMTADPLYTFDGNTFEAGHHWGFPEPQKMVVTARRVGWAGTWGWVAAELRVTGTMYAEPEGAGDPHPKPEAHIHHWMAIVVPDGAAVKTRMLMVTHTDDDTGGDDTNSVQTLFANTAASPLVALLAQPAQLAKQLANDPNTVVFGSGSKESAFGVAKAKKLLASWSKLTFEVADTDGKNQFVNKADYVPIEKTFGDVSFARARVRYKSPKAKRWVMVDALVIARNVNGAWQPVVVGYGAN